MMMSVLLVISWFPIIKTHRMTFTVDGDYSGESYYDTIRISFRNLANNSSTTTTINQIDSRDNNNIVDDADAVDTESQELVKDKEDIIADHSF